MQIAALMPNRCNLFAKAAWNIPVFPLVPPEKWPILHIAFTLRELLPWHNAYQGSFYSQFKVDLGDPDRYEELGALLEALNQGILYYNTKRMHSILKMTPHFSVNLSVKEIQNLRLGNWALDSWTSAPLYSCKSLCPFSLYAQAKESDKVTSFTHLHRLLRSAINELYFYGIYKRVFPSQ